MRLEAQESKTEREAREELLRLVETHGLDWALEELANLADEGCLPSYEGATFLEIQASKRWAAVTDMLSRSAKVVRGLLK